MKKIVTRTTYTRSNALIEYLFFVFVSIGCVNQQSKFTCYTKTLVKLLHYFMSSFSKSYQEVII